MNGLETIVDEADNVLTYKHWSEVNYDNDIYRVATLWIENSNSEVLIAQRKWTKTKDPGKWGPAAAGTVEQGETYETNIYKEAEEEIGLTGLPFEFVAKYKVENPRKYYNSLYKATVDWPIENFVIQEDEVEQITWMPKNEFLEDYSNNPDKYIPSMKLLIDHLSK